MIRLPSVGGVKGVLARQPSPYHTLSAVRTRVRGFLKNIRTPGKEPPVEGAVI
jgi:hypothetical protein